MFRTILKNKGKISIFSKLRATKYVQFLPKFNFCEKNNKPPNNIKETADYIIMKNNPMESLKDSLNENKQEDNSVHPKNDGTIKDEIKLETVPLVSKKFELSEEEKLLPQKTYVFFSSPYSIICKNDSKIGFDIGKISLENLNKDFAFFLHGDPTQEIYRVGVVLDKSVNKEIKKEFKAVQKGKIKFSSLTAKIKIKATGSRVKITEIMVNEDGILVKCIPYIDFNNNMEENFPIKNEVSKLFSTISTIKSSLGYDKINGFDDYLEKKEDLKEYTPEKIDEVIYKILVDLEKINKFLKDPLSITAQIVLESRCLITRVLFIRKKLEKICNSLEIVNRNFKAVEDSIRRQEMMNRAKMALDYIKFSSNSYKEVQEEENITPQQEKPQQKKYFDQLHLIADETSREKIKKEIERFHSLDKYAGEYHKIAAYLDEVFAIPWNNFTDPHWDVDYTSDLLEKHIYGLEKVKERIIEMVAVNKLKKSDKFAKGFIILLEGPPGTGKTSIAKHIAATLKRTSRLISFSGVADSHFIKGHRRTYVDSQPGVFIKEIIKAGCMNPVFILDEIDKMSQTKHGSDPYTALLEILNPEENMNFVDHYLDIKVDFSNVIFILTANDVHHILEPLKNRLEIITIDGYIEEEKLEIAHKYILPQVFEECGITTDLIKFNDDALKKIIKGWCYDESGVRKLRRCFEKICRKHVAEIMGKLPEPDTKIDNIQSQENNLFQEIKQELAKSDKTTKLESNIDDSNKKGKKSEILRSYDSSNSFVISNDPKVLLSPNLKPQDQKFEINQPNKTVSSQPTLHELMMSDFTKAAITLNFTNNSDDNFETLRKFLGPPLRDSHLEERSTKVFVPGIVNILSVSGEHIGNVLKVECIYDKTKPNKKGEFSSTGNLKTVTQESLLIAKINAYRYLTKEQISEVSAKNVHIHFMSGAAPKDGPSAGISFCTAFLSLVLNKRIPANLSMTGELSLNGDVCKIGGVNAKIIASKSLNINVIILPYLNLEEVLDLPKKLLDGITLYFVKEFKEVYKLIFENNEESIYCLENGNLKIKSIEFKEKDEILIRQE